MHIDTEAAAVDLAGAQVHQLEEVLRHARLPHDAAEGQQVGQRIGKGDGRVLHPGIHGSSPSNSEVVTSGVVGCVMQMTKLDLEM